MVSRLDHDRRSQVIVSKIDVRLEACCWRILRDTVAKPPEHGWLARNVGRPKVQNALEVAQRPRATQPPSPLDGISGDGHSMACRSISPLPQHRRVIW